jgi:hypothetical protein
VDGVPCPDDMIRYARGSIVAGRSSLAGPSVVDRIPCLDTICYARGSTVAGRSSPPGPSAVDRIQCLDDTLR